MARVSMLEQDSNRDSNDDVEYLEWEDEEDFVTVRPSGYRVLRAIIALVVLVAIGYYLYTGVRGWFEAIRRGAYRERTAT